MHPASQEDLKKRAYLNQIPSSDDEFDSQSSEDEDFQFNGEIQQIEQFQEMKFEEMSQELEARNRTPTTQLREDVNKVNFHIRENHLNTKSVPNPIKLLVSKQKRRYSLNGFNLDLTYITEKIIAMGFPAENLESVYRNSMQDVQRFFDTLHPGHYKIYNLCEERKYDHSNFKNMVKEFPFQDHQAPTFALIYDFCLDLDQWLKEHEKNVAGIHCKAGKGRTGVMICCYMLFAKQFTNALDSMRYYGMIRTRNKKGVTIPSQIRYIFYFEKALNNRWIPNGMPSKDVDLVKIKMIPVPKLNFMGGCTPWFRIQNGKYEYNSKQANGGKLKSYKLEPFVEFNLQGIYLKDDVLIQFFNDGMIKTGEKIFQAWFNCDFFDHTGILMIDKFMLDKACKDKSGTQFPKDFRIELHVVELTRDTKSIKQDIDSSMKQATIKKFQI